MKVFRIRLNNGWEECNSCELAKTEICQSCDEADLYEPCEQDAVSLIERMELLAA